MKVGEVLRRLSRIYKVEHEEEEIAGAAEEELTLDQFHHCMGHISPEVARKLVKDGMVTGVQLKYTPYGKLFFCSSCVYAKATQKQVLKVRE